MLVLHTVELKRTLAASHAALRESRWVCTARIIRVTKQMGQTHWCQTDPLYLPL